MNYSIPITDPKIADKAMATGIMPVDGMLEFPSVFNAFF
jgi:hypothetical protein